ncbi:MAG: DegV family EDD domain-containing protein [Eubacterium sp.]|nr:DegV family EDD domain-containing protein [Eubacterium sp.]
MNPKKLIQAIRDHNRGLQERMFRLLVMIGLVGLAIGIIVGMIAGENEANTIPILLAFILFLFITCISIHFRKIQLGAVLIACIIIYFVMPVNFLTSGGLYGGGPIWLLFGVVFVCLVVERKIKYVLIVNSFFLYGACYYVAYFYPELIIAHTVQVAYVDSFSTLIIVTILTCGMILFQNAIYREENEIAREQKKEIEELNQMQSRFFSSMSHEIRTPINTIIGLNEMILREEVSDEVAADARSIQGASKMLLTLINDILDMSKIESGRMDIVPVTYDAGDMLSDVVNMIWVRAKEKGLEFHIDVDQGMPSQLFGDEVRIKQILINVLNNAVKYTSEGSVTLSIQCKKMENGQAEISYSVTDTGMGIKKESIPFLFSAFKRVDEEKNRYIEGTGLGLSIVKQLVELMDGDITVNSVYTKGSTFVVTLPQKVINEAAIGELDLETKHTMNAREHYKQSFEAPKAHVLIVDDNETNLMVAEKLLRETKVQIDTVTSGAECLKKILQNRYDVIFMDHLMPEMDGIECLHAIRNQTGGLNRNTPVVVLTANAGGEERALYRREGFDGYLLKPVSGIQLETELLRHLPENLVSLMNTEGSAGVVEAPVLARRKKMPILISTDSTSDLPKYLLEKYQIAVMPFRVCTEGGEFLDGIEAETEGILSYMNEQGKSAQSEPPDVKDYEEFFAEQLTKAQYIIHISIAKHVSKGYERALEASKAFDNVLVVDSGHLSSGMGLMVLCAAEYAAEGMDTDVIVRELTPLKKQVRTSFIVSSTEYLARSGRISEKVDKLCQALMLHPVITLKKGSMKVGAIHIGRRHHVWKKYISSALNTLHEIDKKTLFITYAGLTNEELKEIEELVKSKVSFEKIIYQKASPAISTNCGPGTFGLLFLLKN